MIGELILRCFHARTNAHLLHLKSRSSAQHKALNEFYDGLLGLVDALAEAYQGAHGLITDYSGRYTQADDPVALVEGLKEWIEKNRYDAVAAEETCLHNIIDEIIALCASTTYKLRYLK